MAQDEKEFAVPIKDRRRFNPDGSIRDGEEAAEKPQHSGAEPESKNSEKISESSPSPPAESLPSPEIDFASFILSLASSVQINLGIIPHPMTRKPEINLVAARQTIDILGMLEAKTKGNLASREESILKQILFELRMQYVEMVNKAKK